MECKLLMKYIEHIAKNNEKLKGWLSGAGTTWNKCNHRITKKDKLIEQQELQKNKIEKLKTISIKGSYSTKDRADHQYQVIRNVVEDVSTEKKKVHVIKKLNFCNKVQKIILLFSNNHIEAERVIKKATEQYESEDNEWRLNSI
ncbi:hypothetical protein RCL_jg18765.t1 [Rhizophagus clarus]|uniref:Uncharacterized protein n=1 Tax=Rhizophagus clarus TaxID=94130 RepID=A0A8H3R5T4_9GLOM|nr:hypothetical protein RCL_jg18765.t1 [Rhizophagus clarus]